MLSLTTILENMAEKAKQSGSMIALFIPTNLAKKLQRMFEDVQGDPVLPRDEHVTLLLVENFRGNERKIMQILKSVAKQYKPLSISVSSFGFFPPNEHNKNRYVLYARPECDEFKAIHGDLKQACEKQGIAANNGSFEFSPHITIKYCIEQPDTNKSIHETFIVDKIAFAIGDHHLFVNLA